MLRVKVTVAIISKFDFKGPGRKVKFTVAILKKQKKKKKKKKKTLSAL